MPCSIIDMLFKILVLVIFWTSTSSITLVQAHNSNERLQHYISAGNSNILDLLKQVSETSKLVSILDEKVRTYLSVPDNNITFFAPNNDALINSSSNSLTGINWDYHILPNFPQLDWTNITLFESTRYSNNHFTPLLKLSADSQGQKNVGSGLMQYANITKSIQINNGSVVHIIDQVLTVPEDMNSTLTKLGLIKARDMLKNLPLKNDQQITLFIPSNEAFGTVDPNTLGDNLLAQSHVSPSLMTSNIWINGTIIKTLIESVNMTITKQSNNNNWQVSESIQYPARVITLDVLLENGVMHIIDQVLWPTATAEVANDGDRVTKLASNASQTKLNQPISILLVYLVLFVMLK